MCFWGFLLLKISPPFSRNVCLTSLPTYALRGNISGEKYCILCKLRPTGKDCLCKHHDGSMIWMEDYHLDEGGMEVAQKDSTTP